MYEITNCLPFAGTSSSKFPSKSVTVPTVVPFTIIEAPITGSPSSPITLPVTFEVCAETTPALNARNSSTEVNFFFINTLIY